MNLWMYWADQMAFVQAVTLACVLQAASVQHVPPVVILSLMKTEGGRVGAWRTNENGSHDLGPLQINDRTWVPRLARMQFGGNQKEAEAALIYDGCYNVSVGAYIFHRYLEQAGGNIGVAVGYYNSHTPYFANRYRVAFLHSLDTFIHRPKFASGVTKGIPGPLPTHARAPESSHPHSSSRQDGFNIAEARPPVTVNLPGRRK